jgi:hypothetical protein
MASEPFTSEAAHSALKQQSKQSEEAMRIPVRQYGRNIVHPALG